jgi:hypothetical protein
MRRAHAGFQALVLGGVVACGGSTDASTHGHADASSGEPAEAAAPDRAPDAGSSSCQALGEGVERVAAGLRNVGAIDANLSSITLTLNTYPNYPGESRLVTISKSTCHQRILLASPDPLSDISATDRLVVWNLEGRTLLAEAPAWSATPLDVPKLLGVESRVNVHPIRNGHDDLAIAFLGIETDPSRFVLAGLDPDRIAVLAELSGLACSVQDVARSGEAFLLAGGVVVLDVGPRGCVALASSTGAPRLIFETDQFVPREIVAHAGLAYFPTGSAILSVDPASGASAVFVAEPAEVIADAPAGMYWAGAGHVQLTPWSGGPSRVLARARQATFIAVDDEHVYWLEIADDQGALGESYDLMRVAR